MAKLEPIKMVGSKKLQHKLVTLVRRYVITSTQMQLFFTQMDTQTRTREYTKKNKKTQKISLLLTRLVGGGVIFVLNIALTMISHLIRTRFVFHHKHTRGTSIEDNATEEGGEGGEKRN